MTQPKNIDFFVQPKEDLDIIYDKQILYRPVNTLDSASPLIFNISNSENEYMSLKDTVFYLKLKITISSKVPLPTLASVELNHSTWDFVAPVNNFMHSIFKNVEIEVNGKPLVHNHNNYAYKSYFDSLFRSTLAEKEGILKNVIYEESDKGERSNTHVNAKLSKLIKPTEFKDDGSSDVITLFGKLNIDFFRQNKALIGATNIRIVLHPNNLKFFMISQGASVEKVEFLEAMLSVRKATLEPSLFSLLEKGLYIKNAIYPIERSEIRTFSVAAGLQSIHLDVLNGQIPKAVCVGFVNNKRFNGVASGNPLKFSNLGVNFLSLKVDGVSFPSIPFTPDFANKSCAFELESLYRVFNKDNQMFKMSKDDFVDNKAFYAIQILSDFLHNKKGISPYKHGNVTLEFKTTSSLTDAITVIVYLQYDNYVTITKEREVLTDYM